MTMSSQGEPRALKIFLPQRDSSNDEHLEFPAIPLSTPQDSPAIYLEVYSNDFPWYSDSLPGTQARNVESSIQNWNVRDFELLCRFPLYDDAGLPARVLQGLPEPQCRQFRPRLDNSGNIRAARTETLNWASAFAISTL